ncbi:MAG: hypothetical protein DDT19_00082 [Syntrophomonadaceae bacterium]|nr:hypothetical protein [Bacillota bacterium]
MSQVKTSSLTKPDLVASVLESKERNIKNFPCKSNRASQCGHPCEKYLVLSRTRWQEKVLHDVGLELIFEGGRMIEDMALQELREAGYQIIEQQSSFEWRDIALTGHLDAKVVVNGQAIPLEVKGYQHYEFEKLNSLEDFFNSSKLWVRMAPAQLMMYMMSAESELGIFYLKDKLNYRPKVIWVELDYHYCEQIVQKLERVNRYIKEGTLPAGVDDYDICQRCAFLHICLPELKAQAMEIIDSQELEEKLLRREELSPLAKEYQELDKEIKKMVEGKEKLLVGDFLIQGKRIERKEYSVNASSYWQCKILRVQSGGSKINAD